MRLTSSVYQTEITRYYKASFVSKNGFLPATTTNERLYEFKTDEVTHINNEVSKREVSVFDNRFLDTSAITLLNLAKEYECYETERAYSFTF